MSSNFFQATCLHFGHYIQLHIKLFLALLVSLFLAGCQVAPLYSNATQNNVAKIDFSEAETRLEQVTRNHLVFLNGGASDQVAQYRLSLNVTRSAVGVLGSGTDNNFTAGRMNVKGVYKLIRISDDEVIKSATQQTFAQYDLPNQQFSRIRALQDAENRAGRELAELIYKDIAIALKNK